MTKQNFISSLDGAAAPRDPHQLCATGEMADRIRTFPWENTSLGPMSQWPPSLVGAIGTMLESCFPTAILWGPEMLQFYNDAYIPLAADKHPSLLGQSTPAQWPESWPVVGSQLEAVLHRGERFYQEKVLVPCRRNNVIQDVYWTYSYSPLRLVGGAVGGVLVICQDLTGEVLATRERDALALNLQSVLDSITDGLVVLDKEWRCSYSNDQGARIIGLRPEDLTGARAWDLFPHARGTKFYEGCHLAIESGRPVHFEEFYPDPLNLWLECHCYPSERVLSVYFRDITERKLAEEAIHRSEERFRTLFDLAPVGVAITDAVTGRLLFSNEQMSRITGYTAEELKGMTSSELTHPQDRDENQDLYRRVETGATEEVVMTKRYVRKDGRVVWVRVCVRAIHDPAYRNAQLLGTVEDITESRMAQRAIKENEARLTALVDSIPTLAWMAEKDGSVFWYNRRWYEYTGTDAEQMKG
ncbi:MAG TPA: PAS domain S-box protein, partial [Acidobacteriaceae bacterium]|nr:PAS domain S-box protein [Acidobacteriaceae bacterium]